MGEAANEAPGEVVYREARCVLTMAESDPATGKIVWREFHHNAITRKHTNVILAHSSTKVSQNLMLILKFHLELCVRKRFENGALNGDRIWILTSRSFCGGSRWLNATAATSAPLLLCLLL